MNIYERKNILYSLRELLTAQGIPTERLTDQEVNESCVVEKQEND